MNTTRTALTALAILIIASSLSAQTGNQAVKSSGTQIKPVPSRDMNDYVVSAKAGVVNLIEGEANVIRAHAFAMPETLISGDDLNRGDTVKTAASGRAEILLSPGCYLRLGNASQFVFLFDENGDNRIKLVRGSAVIEASAIDDSIFVETANAKFEIMSEGLYRFNVGVEGKPEIIVRKGRALVNDKPIKESMQAIIVQGAARITKSNKNEVDELDDWSKDRAKVLIAANKSLSRQAIKRTVGIGLMYNTWIYDPFGGFYTFLPFTGGFYSPYGWGYSVCNPYWYRFGWQGQYGGWYGGNGGRGNHRGGSGGGTGGAGGGSGSGHSGGGNSSGGNSGSGHIHNPPPPSPPVFTDSGRGAGGGDRGGARETPAPIHRHP